MKKFFHYLAAALLVGTSLAATSCSDDPEEPIIPQFPTPLPEQTVLPGESCNITITPNMTWEVAIPEEARSWFYLDDNGTKVSKLHGAAVAAGQSITIKVGAENVEIFDAVKPVEVTMTMNAETKTIATLSLQHKERELKFRMAKIENDEYAFNEDAASPLQYSYEAEAKTDGSVQLERHGGYFYGARLLVESNVPWTISVPDWIEAHVNAEAATSGAAGQSEVELRAKFANMPLEGAADVVCQFNAAAADGSAIELAKIAVSLENLTGLLEYELPKEALFSARGNYLVSASTHGPSINATITAPEGVKIIAIAPDMWGDLAQCDWVTPAIDPWSGEDKIQSRYVSISVAPQQARWDAAERQAFVYVLPATMKDVTADNVIAKSEEYKNYLATTITQEASTFLLNSQNSLAMKENGVKFDIKYDSMFDSTLWQWDDWMHNDNGIYYKLTYTNEYSVDGGALDVGPMPDGGPTHYTSYKIYGYNVGSAGENLPEDNKWIKLQEVRNAETNVVESFKVQMNFDQEYVNTYGDFSMKYAVIVFYDENGTAIATLECEYNENASTGGDTGSLSLGQYASYEGTTLEKLSAGDVDYDKYAGAYADFSPSVYRVTFITVAPTMSGISGLPNYAQYCEVIDGAEWLSRPEPSMEVTFAGLMNTQKSAKGAYIFYTGGSGFDEATQKVIDPQGPAVILVVNLVLE